MEIPKLNKWQKVTIIIAILYILNPSIKNFKDDLGILPPLHQGLYYAVGDTPARKVNLLIASVFSYDGTYYIGIVKNFIPIYTKK